MAADTIDLDFYTWREPIGDRLVVPHADPHHYEDPWDYIYPSIAAARSSLESAVENEIIDQDEADEWVLVHYVGTIVTDMPTCSLTFCDDPYHATFEHDGTKLDLCLEHYGQMANRIGG